MVTYSKKNWSSLLLREAKNARFSLGFRGFPPPLASVLAPVARTPNARSERWHSPAGFFFGAAASANYTEFGVAASVESGLCGFVAICLWMMYKLLRTKGET